MKRKPNKQRRARLRIGTIERLTKHFHELGIKPTKPGFYDDKEFIEAEQRIPSLLESYAKYVDAQVYSSDYIERARNITTSAVKYLSDALQKEGQMQACIDTSLTLARFLERKGIWCYIVKGALSIEFPKNPTIASQVLAPYVAPGNPATAGHVWIVAPPFNVVDLTAKLQPYPGQQSKFLPAIILSDNTKRLQTFDLSDLFDTDAYNLFIRQYGKEPSHEDMRRIDPGLYERISSFGVHEVQTEHAELTYIACAIAASAEPFEEADNLVLGGKPPLELFTDWDNRSNL